MLEGTGDEGCGADPWAQPGLAREETTTQPAGAEILLVEDDSVLAGIVRRNLEVRGYRARLAPTAAAALEALAQAQPAVMLLDVNLPDGSGWDVLRALGAEGRHVPTVVLSAVQVSRTRLSEFRPEAHLPKPFPLDALLATVERLSRPAPTGR